MVHHSAAGDESQELVERQAAAAVGPWRGRLWRSWRGRIRLPSTSELDPTNNNTSKTCMHDPNLTTTRIPHRTHAVLLAPRRLLVHQKVHVAVPAPSGATRIILYAKFVFRDHHPVFLKTEIPELPIEERPSSRTCLCESRNIGRSRKHPPRKLTDQSCKGSVSRYSTQGSMRFTREHQGSRVSGVPAKPQRSLTPETGRPFQLSVWG